MKREYFEELIRQGHEIEFDYRDKRYSITYYNDDREAYISFCEFYQTPKDVATVEELLELQIDGRSLEEVLFSLPEKAFDIF